MLFELQKALVLNQRVELTVWDPDNDSVEHSFQGFVMKACGSQFQLTLPPVAQAAAILPLLQPGLVTGAVVEAYPSPYIFYPIIHSSPQSPESGFWLKIPENPQIELLQNRRHVRIPMIIPFNLEYAVSGRSMAMQARTEDVSGGGMRFTSIRQFPQGQDLLISLSINPSAPTLRLKARVVFSVENRLKKQPDDLYSTACQFVDLTDAEEMLLVRECFKRELSGFKR
jgi:hypothetical protein